MSASLVFTAVSEIKKNNPFLTVKHVYWFHNQLTLCNFPVYSVEKRSSGGGSFSSFRIPSQKDPGLRLKQKPDDQDEEGKENMETRGGCESDKRLSTNGDMDIP